MLVQAHLVWLPSLTGLASREAGGWPVPGCVKDELHGFLTCGILCFGFARVKPNPQAPGVNHSNRR